MTRSLESELGFKDLCTRSTTFKSWPPRKKGREVKANKDVIFAKETFLTYFKSEW